MMKLTWTPRWLNFTLFGVGMIGVWVVSESWLALMWTWIASLHFTFTVKP